MKSVSKYISCDVNFLIIGKLVPDSINIIKDLSREEVIAVSTCVYNNIIYEFKFKECSSINNISPKFSHIFEFTIYKKEKDCTYEEWVEELKNIFNSLIIVENKNSETNEIDKYSIKYKLSFKVEENYIIGS